MYRPPSGGTAETLVLVALILQVLGAAIPLVIIGAVAGFAIFAPFPFVGWVLLGFGIVGALAVLFLYLAYEYCYVRIRRGEYEAAQAPTLVFGIISLFLGVVPGILYLVAYVKLGDAIRERTPLPSAAVAGYGAPATPTFYRPLACTGCGRVYAAGEFRFCPNCGRPMSGSPPE